jgi:exonuclease SbcC
VRKGRLSKLRKGLGKGLRKELKKNGIGEKPMIEEVKLLNIKSYSNQSIRFTEGINAIIGENGAGKTTILEAIGFTLFDFLPYRIGDFLRRGESRGEIRVKVVGKDDRIYEIVRKISETGTLEYYVNDPETARVAEGIAEVTGWIKENFRIDIDTKTIFENAIGVSQGKIVSQFLETPSVRDKIFSPILGVEGYKKAFEKSREYENFVKDRIADVEKRIAVLQKEAEFKQKLEEKREELKEQQNRLRRYLKEVEADTEPIKRKLDEFDSISSQLKSLELKEAHVLAQIDSLEKEIKRVREELEEIKNAENEIRKLEQSYESYVKAEEKLSILEPKRAELDRKIDELRGLSIELEKVKAELKNIRERLEDIEEREEELKSIESMAEREKGLKDELKNIELAEKNLEAIEAQIENLKNEIKKKKQVLKEIQEKELKLKEFESKLELLLDVEEKRDALLKAISGIKAQIEIEKKQYEQLKSGVCPVLSEECERIISARNLKKRELEKALEKLRELEEKYDKLEKIFETKKKVDEAISRLKGEVKARNNIDSEIEQKKREFEELSERAGELKKLVNRKEEVLNELSSVEGSLERKAAILQVISQKNSLLEKLKQKAYEGDQISKKVALFPEINRELNEIRKEIERLKKVREENKEGFQRYLQLKDRILKKEETLEAYEKLRQQKEVLSGEYTKLSKTLKELRSFYSEDEHKKLRDLLQELVSRKSGIEGELRSVEGNIDEVEKELREASRKEEELKRLEDKRSKLERKYRFIKDLRELFKLTIPEITKAYAEAVSIEANRTFCNIIDDYGWELRWTEDFGIKARYMGREMDFTQLSGGEQMCAALSIRLALLKVLSDIGIAFFDEPTQNMDEARRRNLASQLSKIEGFKQIFVISHDDTFEEMVENAVKVKKMKGVSVVE